MLTTWLKLHFIIYFLILPLSVKAENQSLNDFKLQEKTKNYRVLLFTTTSLALIKKDETQYTGLALGADFNYAITPLLAVGGSANQSIDLASKTSLFTEVGISINYAHTGRFIKKDQDIYILNKKVYSQKEFTSSSIISTLHSKQYFFNASESVIPLPGIGYSISYRFASKSFYFMQIGAGIDSLSNGKHSLNPWRLFLNIGIWP